MKPERVRPALLVRVRRLARTYPASSGPVTALRGIDLDLVEGARLAVMGRSGSGKSTLLAVLGALERPDEGEVHVAGHDLGHLSPRERDRYRRRVVGYVWQRFEVGILPGLTVFQNVLLPQLAGGRDRGDRRRTAIVLLQALRLGQRLEARPAELTSLEVRRLAVAVALANRPRLLLLDEITAGLDRAAARELLDDLDGLVGRTRTAIVLVTHDDRLCDRVDRVLVLRDGAVLADTASSAALR
ncbi:MAG TPA: ATP-binding cassette domain-containing protein [Candidatus Dormibacteraeota bacterium]|jgi:ABC-type lipoprotein export system ATPase subunit|nr:ATP-binding cassette domain-containing protein [Candidatus Dormibacteraeota bacterium]